MKLQFGKMRTASRGKEDVTGQIKEQDGEKLCVDGAVVHFDW